MIRKLTTIALVVGTIVAILTLTSGCSRPTSAPTPSEPTRPAPLDDGIDDSIRAIKAEIQKRKDLDAANTREATSKLTGSSSAESLFASAELNRKGNQFGHAIKDLDETIRLKPDWADAYALRAACRFDLRDREQAKVDCQKALSLDPMYVRAIAVRSLVKLDDNDLAGAMEDAVAAVRSDPSEVRPCLRYGLV